MESLGAEHNESFEEQERKLTDLIQCSIGRLCEVTTNDISQCRKDWERRHAADFEFLRKRLAVCEEELQKAKTDSAAIKTNEEDIERQEKKSGDLNRLIVELTNRVNALEAEDKKKDEKIKRLEAEQIKRTWTSGAESSGADLCISLGCNFLKHPQGQQLKFPHHCCLDCKKHGVEFHGRRCQGKEACLASIVPVCPLCLPSQMCRCLPSQM